MAVIVDGAAYFERLQQAIAGAERQILMIGWDFDTRVALARGDDPARQTPTGDSRIGTLLRRAVRARPMLRVHVLRWDLAVVKMAFRGTTLPFLLDWMTHDRLTFRLDAAHPIDSCHHQKLVVIDDVLAFCGGIDVTRGRWDTPAHLDDDQRRTDPDGEMHMPWHDATAAVNGPAAAALGELARDRWLAATGEELTPPPPLETRWPDGLEADFEDVGVGIARTIPAFDGTPAVREIEALYLAAIAAAKRTIYIESQYFSEDGIAEALAARLAEPDGPDVVLVLPLEADGWLEAKLMDSVRTILVERCQAADSHDRLRVLTPVTEAEAAIYVHAKVMVIDDRLLRIGSSNINRRSMVTDTECDLAVEVTGSDAASGTTAKAILAVRDRLLAEHLGLEQADWQAMLATHGGQLVAAVDAARRPQGRSLQPLPLPLLDPAERALAAAQIDDEDAVEVFSAEVTKAAAMWQRRPGLAAGVGIGLGAVALAAVWLARRKAMPGEKTPGGAPQ